MRDFKDAVRALRASGGSTTVALILLTIGIGASTAIFSVVDAVLRGLPFPAADQLVAVSGTNTRTGARFGVTPQDYLDWKVQQDVFDGLAAVVSSADLVVKEDGRNDGLARTRVTANLFDVLGVQPRIGRAFTAANEIDGSHRVVVLSDALWRRRYGADPGVVGRTIRTETGSYEILGVMPRGFEYPLGSARPTEVYAPYVVAASQRVRGQSRSFALEVIGRLKPGVSVQAASARMEQIHQGLVTQFPDWFQGRGIAVRALRESLIGRAQSWMLLLTGAVGFLLLLVCANVSGLALARGLTRAREIGIRTALGASRSRIARGIVIENLLLASGGAIGGAALAYAGVEVLRAAVPPSLPRVSAIAVDARILAAAGFASLLTALVCSVLPAMKFSRGDVARTLRDGARPGDAGPSTGAAGAVLVIAEVGLSVILLVGAGLFVGSFSRLMRVDLGLDYRNVLTVPAFVQMAAGETRAKAAERAAVMLPAVLERVSAVPGVEAVGAIGNGLPLSGGNVRFNLQVRGRVPPADDDLIDVHPVNPDYFRALHVPLLSGRLFSPADTRDGVLVALLNESAAKTFFPSGDAIGAIVGLERDRDAVVVGIVGDVRLDGPEYPYRPEAYVPLSQSSVVGVHLVVRSTADPVALASAVKASMWSVDPTMVVRETPMLESHLERIISPRKFNMLLFTALGVLAMAIAATGIYGLLSQQVQQREREIGVRIALGALPRQILSLVIGGASRYLGAGLVAGIAGAWALAGFVESFLFTMTPYDVTVYASAGALLIAIGLLAALVPALRAIRTDPVSTLKA